MDIREAVEKDCPTLVRLIFQLGYEPSTSDLEAGLALYSTSRDRVLVVEDEGVVLGSVVLNVLQPFHVTAPWGRVSALVVEKTVRGKGIGALLLEAAERYFVGLGCSTIELTSNETRVAAHRFYVRNGFEEKPKRFVKKIGS